MKKYYGVEGQERLSDSAEEVIIDIVTGEEDYQGYPIKIYVFEPINPFRDIEKYARNLLDNELETLDDEYSDPYGDYTKPTEKMINASLNFAKVMRDEYQSWMCEPTGEVLEFSKEYCMEITG